MKLFLPSSLLQRSLALRLLVPFLVGLVFVALALFTFLDDAHALDPGDVTITLSTSPILTADSNQCPAQGPRANYVGFTITNTSGGTLTDLEATISDFDTALGFSLGLNQLATQYIGTLAPGASDTVYWYVLFPCDALSDTLTVTVNDANPGTVSGTGTVTVEEDLSSAAGGTVISATVGAGAAVGQIITYDVYYEFASIQDLDFYNIQPAANDDFDAGCLQLVTSEILYSEAEGVPAGTMDDLFYQQTTGSQPGGTYDVLVRYYLIYLCEGQAVPALPYSAKTSGNPMKYTDNYGECAPDNPAIQCSFPSAIDPFTIGKSAYPTQMDSPGIVTYTITISNSSAFDSRIERFTDTLPPELTFIDEVSSLSDITTANSSKSPTTGMTGTLVWIGNPPYYYTVTANSSIDLVYTAMVNVTSTVPYTNTAIAKIGQVIIGPAEAPVCACPLPELDSTKSDTLLTDADGNGLPSAGDTIRYTVTITNSGLAAAAGVTFSDTPDANTTLVVGSVTTSLGSVTSGNTGGDTSVEVTMPVIPGGTVVTITFDVTINNPLPTGVTTISNQGTVEGLTLPPILTDDPDTPTLDDPTVTPLAGPPILDATKQDSLLIDADGNGFASPGDTIRYQVTIVNSGQSPATGVTFSDTPDANTTLVTGSVTTTLGTVTSSTGSVGVNIGTIPAGGTVTIAFRVTINNPLPTGVTTISNQGTVSSSTLPPVPTDDPDTTNVDDPTTTPVTAAPILDATKQDSLLIDADGNGFASAGDTIRYEVTIVNSGNSSATGVTFSDTPDANTTLVTGSVTTTLGTVTSSTGSVGVNIGTIPAGGTVTIAFRVTIDNPLPAGVTTISNQGTVSSSTLPPVLTDDPDTPTLDDPTVTPLVGPPILDATKQDSLLIDADGNGFASPGDTIRYQVTIVNSGQSAATGVTFSDTPDANTTLVTGSVTTTLGTVTSSTGSVGVNIGTIPAGGTVTIAFRVTVNNPLPAGTLTVVNQGTVSSSTLPPVPTDDPDTTNVDDPTSTPVTAAPILDATKQDSLLIDADGNGLPSPGDTIRYQVTIVNSGNSSATGVTFSDTPDANTTLVTGSVTTTLGTVTSSTGSVGVNIGTIPAGGTVTIAFRVTINNPLPAGVTTISNQGTVSSSTLPPVPTDDPDTPTLDDPTVTPLAGPPILDATKQDSLLIDADGNGLPSAGDTIRYQVTIVNGGQSPATGVTFSDTPDANTTLVTGSVTTTLGTVTSSTGSVGVNIGTIPAGGTVTIAFRVTIDNPLPTGVTQIANQGTVSSSTLPPVPTDDPDTPTLDDPTVTPLAGPPILDATKRDSLLIDADGNGFASPGDTIRYQVTIVNSGQSPATGVTFSDTPDANTTLVTGSVTTTLGTVTSSTGSVGVNIGTIPAGGTVTIAFRVTVNNPLPAGTLTVVNQGTVSSSTLPPVPTDDPDTTNVDDPTSTPVTAAPILDATKQDSLLIDADGNGLPSPGDTIRYQVTIINSGNSSATGVTFSDTPDANTTLVTGSVTTTLGTVTSSTGSVGVDIGTIPAGGSVTIAFRVTIDNPLPAGVTTISNQGTVSSPNLPPVPTDDPDTPTLDDPTVTPLAGPPILDATKQDSLLIDADGNGFASPGDTIRYQVTIVNSGQSAATGVTFSDTPDVNTTLVTGSVTTTLGTVTSSTGSVGVNIGTIPAGGSVTIAFRVTVNNPLPTGVTQLVNQGTISRPNLPPVLTDDPDTPTLDDPTSTPIAVPILDATKRDSLLVDADGNGFPSPGDTIRYEVTIVNSGNSPATGVTFSDTPDANTTLVTGSVTTTLGTVTSSTGSVGVNIGTIPAGGTVTIAFRVIVDNPLPAGTTMIANQGLVSSPTLPPVLTDDPDTPSTDDPTTTPVTAAPILDATKRDSLLIDADNNGFPSPGDTLGYQVIIVNRGNSPATSVIFTDTLDTDTALVPGSVTTTLGTATTSGNQIVVNIGTIPAGGSVTITFRATIDSPLPAGTTMIANQGLVSSPTLPPVPTDDPDTPEIDDPTDTPVTAAPILDATKRDTLLTDLDGNGIASPGDTLLYQITIANSGNSPATAVTFSDTPDANTTLVIGSVTTSLGAITSGNSAGNTTVAVNIGTIPAGGSVTITFRATIDSPLPAGVTRIANQGLVQTPLLPPVPTDDPDTPTLDDPTSTPVTAAPFLTADKRVSLFTDADNNGLTSPGDTLLYQITIRNSGNSPATGVTFSDTPDVNTTLVVGSVTTSLGAVTSGNTPGNTSVGVTIGTLPGGGASVTIAFRVRILNPLPSGTTTINNQGVVTSQELPPIPTNDPTTPSDGDPTTSPVTSLPILSADKDVTLVVDADNNGMPSPGDSLLYQITIINSGNGAATGITFSDTPDVNTTLVVGSVATTMGTITSGNTPGNTSVGVNIGTLPGGGASLTISYRVTINNPLPAGVTQVVNQGLVNSTELPPVPTNEPDSPTEDDPTNTPVAAVPLLTIDKRDLLYTDADGNGLPSPGDTLLYEVNLINSGNAPVTGVVFSDTLDVNTTLVVGSVQTTLGTIIRGNNAGDTGVEVNIGTILGGGSRVTVGFLARINDPLPSGVTQIVNQAIATSNELPPVPTNDPNSPTEDDPTNTPITVPTAVTLALYTAQAEAGGVRLQWQTIMESGTAYFTLVRAPVRNLDAAQPVEGVRIYAGQGSYEAFDPGGNPGDWYWLVEHHWSGSRSYYGPVQVAGSRLFLPLMGMGQ